ncbi:TspO/MBR family protein [Marinilactibacillus sp. Marseille-P9653]|uniref:TspO/MBR family protein n=1 Tax=Marinilactibacillus sp. Marseille-P9653 TaxID=2866583 RepID=UPI001CE4419F|nr:TspO/MBR family protein [Marinilactibacillus sp. Marseille-P9653]
MSKSKKFGILYLVVFGVMIFLNYWSATDVGSTADDQQALIQPAGFAFSIWGLIYLSVLIWIVRLFFIKQFEGTIYDKVKVWLLLNFALNGAWIIMFTGDQIGLSTVVIVGLLLTLVMIYRTISKIRYNFFDRFPFSIYFGWVTVATIVNIFTWAVSSDVQEILGLSELNWTVILLVVATILCVYISLKYTDWSYPLVFVWSFTGIIIENTQSTIILLAGVCIAVQALSTVYTAYKAYKTERVHA